MSKAKMDINQIRELHRTGKLEPAKQGYLAILRKNPRDIEALHSVGVISAQQKDFSNAVNYLEQAIRYQPNEPSFHLHLANVLKIQGLFSQAAELLEKTVASHPDYVPAFNNLGTVYYAKGKLDAAIRLYRQAIAKQPNYADAYYNLGLALIKNGEPAEAIHLLEKLLEHVPDHFAARFHLACAHMQQDHFALATQAFLIIESSHPHHVETQSNLATCYLKQGLLAKAKSHYLKALELSPEDTQNLFNLGYLNMQLGDLDNAIQFYQRTVSITPDSFAAQNNLGAAFLAKPHIGLALQHFREALRIQPGNKSIAYTIQALEQNQPLLTAPPDYVQSLFDAYADHYDMHLLDALDYQVPQLLHHALTSFLSKSQPLDVLDLGCGTGLCALPLKPYAQTLTGVDLSPKMLEAASQKQLYTQLIVKDLTDFLMDKVHQYDLIIAGDALVYMGDLSRLFALVKQALRPHGFFAFNAEICTDTPFKMNQSGRFAHNKKYLDDEAAKNHLRIAHYQAVITRQQNNEPVYGHLYILRSL
jgi:predicted TPR repeat methyltransferase